MRRTLVVLSWTLVALVVSERVLSLLEAAERRSSSRLRRLAPADVLEGKAVAAIRVQDTARGEALLFARTSTGWQCLSRWGAPADEARLQGVVERLLDGHGLAQRVDRARTTATYGLAPPQLLRVSLHGPRVLTDRDRDLVALFEIGATLPGGRGTYARYDGSVEVIAVDGDLRQHLTSAEESASTPLLDPHLVPRTWSARADIERIDVQPERGTRFALRKRERAIAQEEILAGGVPWEWLVIVGGAERVVPGSSVHAYAAFLQQATYKVPIDPRPRRLLGLDPPRARVVLHPAEGEPLEVQVGGRTPDGIAVRNALTQSVFVMAPEVAALLVPSSESFRDGVPNAWDAALRVMMSRPGSPLETLAP